MKLVLITILIVSFGIAGVGQEQTESEPHWKYRFEDFKVDRVFRGKPAPAKIVTRSDREFRTRIREGATEGPNFAGHYTIVYWGCGSGCVSFAVVDAESGMVSWNMPFQTLGVPFQGDESGNDYKGLQYKVDSRLLIADGCPGDENCGTYYFEWERNKFQKKGFDPRRPGKR